MNALLSSRSSTSSFVTSESQASTWTTSPSRLWRMATSIDSISSFGEFWDNKKHKQGTEIKAITYSNMQVRSFSRPSPWILIDPYHSIFVDLRGRRSASHLRYSWYLIAEVLRSLLLSWTHLCFVCNFTKHILSRQIHQSFLSNETKRRKINQ